MKFAKNELIMTIQEKVGKAIVILRKERKLSQEALSYESGIDRRYMSDIENGKRNTSIDVITRICIFFNIKLSEFFSIVESLE